VLLALSADMRQTPACQLVLTVTLVPSLQFRLKQPAKVAMSEDMRQSQAHRSVQAVPQAHLLQQLGQSHVLNAWLADGLLTLLWPVLIVHLVPSVL